MEWDGAALLATMAPRSQSILGTIAQHQASFNATLNVTNTQNQQTRKLNSARRTSHKLSNKDPSRLR